MVILGEVLVVGGSALVVTNAIFWVWSLMKPRLLRGPDEDSGWEDRLCVAPAW
jgi:hypothetical protein